VSLITSMAFERRITVSRFIREAIEAKLDGCADHDPVHDKTLPSPKVLAVTQMVERVMLRCGQGEALTDIKALDGVIAALIKFKPEFQEAAMLDYSKARDHQRLITSCRSKLMHTKVRAGLFVPQRHLDADARPPLPGLATTQGPTTLPASADKVELIDPGMSLEDLIG
jgi:hypothetical protein